MKIDKKLMGKKARAAGNRFEKRVREELEKKGWVCDKWTNNVEFDKWIEQDSDGKRFFDKENGKIEMRGKLVKAKPKFVYNPKLKRRIPIGMSQGFPDFIAFRPVLDKFSKYKSQLPLIQIGRENLINDIENEIKEIYEIVMVESKMNGILDKEEKEKVKWLLDNNVFSNILIASKGEKRGEIKYKEVKK